MPSQRGQAIPGEAMQGEAGKQNERENMTTHMEYLQKIGVEYVGEQLLRCANCGQQYSPQIRPDSNGRYYRGSVRCPNGCSGM